MKALWPSGLLCASSIASDVLACPMCDTDTAKLVRSGLLDTVSHMPSLLATTLPFAVLAIIVFGMD